MGNWVEQAQTVTWHYIGGRWYWVSPSTSANPITITVGRNSNGS